MGETPARVIDSDSDVILRLSGLFLSTGRTVSYCLAIKLHPVHTKDSGTQRPASLTTHPLIPRGQGADTWPPT